MAEIHILIVPNLRNSYEKTAMMIKNSFYDMIFLNLPRNLQSLISKYYYGKINFNEFIEKLKILLPEPKNTWIYLFEPILKIINEISTEIYCYLENFEEILENSIEITILTLKANITGKIKLEEWLKIIKPLSLNSSIEFIAYKAKGKCLCISNLFGWKIAHKIKKYGHEVYLKCVESFYRLKPLETLTLLLEKSKINPEIAEYLIKEHIKFINEYVLKSNNLDEAYLLWSYRFRK